jgi:hypothetical protein
LEDINMKKTILVGSLMLILAAAPAMSQMMGGGPMMNQQQQQQENTQQQNTPYQMYPGMMGGYGYGMGPGMMRGGYGMGPGMMGYGMGPGMMGGYGYGYGMGPGMMGGYGRGMGPGMMGSCGYPGCGMGPGMMGGYGYGMGPGMMGYFPPAQNEQNFKENQKFFNETRELRKKLHDLKFEYNEALRNPDTTQKDLEKMNEEMAGIWKQIYEKRNE